MAYATVAEFRAYFKDLPVSEGTDDLLEAILERATVIVDGELECAFAPYGGYDAAEELDVWSGNGGSYLYLPCCSAGSVASVALVTDRGSEDETETAVTDYLEESRWRLFRNVGWLRGCWYRVTALWGYGAAPADVVEVTLEVAANIWRGRDTMAGQVAVGAEGGGAVAYNRALTWAQKSVLANVRTRYP